MILFAKSFSQCLSHNFFFTTTFSQRNSHNVFLTTFFSQRLSHNAFLTTYFLLRLCSPLPLNNHPHYVILSTSQYMRNLSVLYKYPKISQIRLSSNPCNFNILLVDQTRTTMLHICNIYSFTVWSIRSLRQRLHTKVPRTKCCINIQKYRKFV